MDDLTFKFVPYSTPGTSQADRFYIEGLAAKLLKLDEDRAEARRNYDRLNADLNGRRIVKLKKKIYNVLWN